MKETTEPGSAGDLLFEDTANPATEMGEDSPWRLFALTVASVFLAEVLVMAILARIPSLPLQAMWIIDGVLAST